jgi:hypothetical protein
MLVTNNHVSVMPYENYQHLPSAIYTVSPIPQSTAAAAAAAPLSPPHHIIDDARQFVSFAGAAMSRTAALAHSPTNTATANATTATAASASTVPLAVGSGAVAHAGTTVYASSQHRVGAGGGMLIRGPLQYASTDTISGSSSASKSSSSSSTAVVRSVVAPPASPTSAKPVVAVVTAVPVPAALNAASAAGKRNSVVFTMPVTATSNSGGDAPGGRATVAALFPRGSGA